jgi:hypothetical protein
VILAAHKPKLGDVIYSLPLLRSWYESGESVTLLLQPASPSFPQAVDYYRAEFRELANYLAQLPYLHDCRVIESETPTHDLDLYRETSHQKPHDRVSIVENHFRAFNEPFRKEDERPWLTPVQHGDELPDIAVAHSGRYIDPGCDWRFINQIDPRSWYFLGTSAESDLFRHRACIHHKQRFATAQGENCVGVIAAISKAKVLYSNQTYALSLALGLGVPSFVEESWLYPNCNVGTHYHRIP